MTVLDFDPERADNGELIADVVKLGYIQRHDRVLDATYGKGTFWKTWKPMHLTYHDIKVDGVDFRDLPYTDDHFEVVVFDPPYKLNGTPDETVDERYGVDVPADWRERMKLMHEGVLECLRVLAPKGYLLVKCQDQVCSGKVRWQTDAFTEWLCGARWGPDEEHGEWSPEPQPGPCRKVDQLHFLGYRAQPDGRRQVHARHNFSTLLIFKKGERSDNF